MGRLTRVPPGCSPRDRPVRVCRSPQSRSRPRPVMSAVAGRSASAGVPLSMGTLGRFSRAIEPLCQLPLRLRGPGEHPLGGQPGRQRRQARTKAASRRSLPGPGTSPVKVTSKPHSSQAFNSKTCRFSFTEDIVLTVVGGKSTGAFAGPSGPARCRSPLPPMRRGSSPVQPHRPASRQGCGRVIPGQPRADGQVVAPASRPIRRRAGLLWSTWDGGLARCR